MSAEQQLGMLLTKEELNRIKIKGNQITVDLHHLKVKEAKRLLNNIVAINRSSFTMECIHGYNHGTALKEMIQGDFNNKRILSKKSLQHNLGLTELTVAAA